MPPITNFTKKIMISAKIRLTLLDSKQITKDFIINQRLVSGAKSNTDFSYLIRSDVPSQLSLYAELDNILKNLSYDKIVLEIVEVRYKN